MRPLPGPGTSAISWQSEWIVPEAPSLRCCRLSSSWLLPTQSVSTTSTSVSSSPDLTTDRWASVRGSQIRECDPEKYRIGISRVAASWSRSSRPQGTHRGGCRLSTSGASRKANPFLKPRHRSSHPGRKRRPLIYGIVSVTGCRGSGLVTQSWTGRAEDRAGGLIQDPFLYWFNYWHDRGAENFRGTLTPGPERFLEGSDIVDSGDRLSDEWTCVVLCLSPWCIEDGEGREHVMEISTHYVGYLDEIYCIHPYDGEGNHLGLVPASDFRACSSDTGRWLS